MARALNTVYKMRNYKIYDAVNGYIVHNTSLPFEGHHTHVNNFNTCKYLINMSLYKRVPKHLSDYLLVSLIRLSDSKSYTHKIEQLLNQNKAKKQQKGNKDEYNRQRDSFSKGDVRNH